MHFALCCVVVMTVFFFFVVFESCSLQVRSTFDDAMKAYQGCISCDPSPATISLLRASLEDNLHHFLQWLSPEHELVFQMYLPLVNLCNHQKDYKAKLDFIRSLLTCAERVFPQYYIVKANYYRAHAQTILQVMQQSASNPPSGRKFSKVLFSHYIDELADTLDKHVDVCRVSCGTLHPMTLRAQQEKKTFLYQARNLR